MAVQQYHSGFPLNYKRMTTNNLYEFAVPSNTTSEQLHQLLPLDQSDQPEKSNRSDQSLVAVVDDDAAARLSLTRLLELEDYSVRQFSSAAELLESGELNIFSCIVTDLRMPRITGLDLQRVLSQRDIPVPLVFVSAFGTVPVSVQAMRGGAVDFLEKPTEPEALLAAVARAVATHAVDAARAARFDNLQRRLSRLTPREREVFDGVARGLTNQGIAEELGIAVKTVKIHRSRVMTKMEADSVADLARDRELLAAN